MLGFDFFCTSPARDIPHDDPCEKACPSDKEVGETDLNPHPAGIVIRVDILSADTILDYIIVYLINNLIEMVRFRIPL